MASYCFGPEQVKCGSWSYVPGRQQRRCCLPGARTPGKGPKESFFGTSLLLGMCPLIRYVFVPYGTKQRTAHAGPMVGSLRAFSVTAMSSLPPFLFSPPLQKQHETLLLKALSFLEREEGIGLGGRSRKAHLACCLMIFLTFTESPKLRETIISIFLSRKHSRKKDEIEFHTHV